MFNSLMNLAALASRLHAMAPTINGRGDHSFSPDLAAETPLGPLKAAAVLIPIMDRPGIPQVLFTRRTTSLRAHSGQIAFPGGRIDDEDEGPLAAALREAHEEIGLDAACVTTLGYLDLYETTTGYLITPVVARVAPHVALTLNPQEVAETFEVPLAFLMDPANHRYEEREWRGKMRRYLAIPFEDRYIWGVTAGILLDLHTRVTG